MKKKNKFKSWLIRVLKNWLSKLEPYHNVVKVEHVPVPLVTVSANLTMSKHRSLPEDYINEILAKQLGEEVFKYANIETYEHFSFDSDTETSYRVTVRVAVDKMLYTSDEYAKNSLEYDRQIMYEKYGHWDGLE